METNISNTCFNCDKPYPAVGFFCGGCLTQLKCKSCSFPLEKDNLGCTNCGTPKDVESGNATNLSQNVNTFKLHETATDRIIEATFSDAVGKDFAGILKDTYTARIGNSSNQAYINNSSAEMLNDKLIDAELIEDKVTDSQIEHTEKATTVNEKLSEAITTAPTLLSIAIKNLPSTEVEWLVVYSYYASNFGVEIFQRKDVILKHNESNRKNKSFSNNLTRSMEGAVKTGYINPLNDGFHLTDLGIQKAAEVIYRESGSTPKFKSNNPSKRANSDSGSTDNKATKKAGSNNSEIKSLKRLSDINFYPDNKENLNDFYNKFQCKSDFERNLIFVYYLEEVLKITGITASHIYTCYDDLDLKVSENLPQTIRNTKSRTGWIDKNTSGFIVTIKGRNKIKLWN